MKDEGDAVLSGLRYLLVLEGKLKVSAVKLGVEEARVEPVDSNVTVLSSRSVCNAGGVNGDGVDRTKVARETCALLLKDLVPESSLESTLSCRSGCDVHSILTTTNNDERLGWMNGSTVQWCLGGVCLYHLQCLGVDEFGGLVSGRGDKVCAVGAHLHVRDHLARVCVGGLLLKLCVDTALGLLLVVIVGCNLAVLVAGDDVLVARGESSDNGLGAREGDGAGGFRVLLCPCGGVTVDAEDTQRSAVTHTLFCDYENLSAIFRPGNTLGSGGELPGEEALAGSHLPKTHLVVGGSRDEECGRG